MLFKKKNNDSPGFTLLELLIVMAVIGLLASVMLVGFSSATKRARIAQGWQFSDSLRGALQMSMVAWWAFNETSGNVAKDSWFDQNHGTLHGNPQWTEGIVNGALAFDGNDYVDIPYFTSLPIRAITVEAWINTPNPTKYRNGVVSGYASMYLGPIDGGHLHWCVPTNTRPCAWSGTIPANQWTHIVGTYDGTHSRAYINGVEVWSSPQTGTIAGTNPITIGNYVSRDATHAFFGIIDEVRIYSAALPQSAVQQHYAEGLKRHQNLVKK